MLANSSTNQYDVAFNHGHLNGCLGNEITFPFATMNYFSRSDILVALARQQVSTDLAGKQQCML